MPDSVLDGLSVEHRAAYWANTLSDASVGQRVWVAESSDHVVGFSHARWRHADAASPPGAEIAALYVLPEYWSMGLGRALLDTAVDALPRRGFETATLWVLRDNGRARRFYERAGWRVDGNVASLEIGGQAVPKVRYQLDLVRTDGLP